MPAGVGVAQRRSRPRPAHRPAAVAADPGRSGFCWLSCGAQPVRKIISKRGGDPAVARRRSCRHRAAAASATAPRGGSAGAGARPARCPRPWRADRRIRWKRVAVADRRAAAVGHRQRKARALQQPAQIADLAHRQHARATGRRSPRPRPRPERRAIRAGSGRRTAPPRNSPSGRSARRHCTSWPTGSLAQCSASAWITRSCAPGSRASTSSSGTIRAPGRHFGPEVRKTRHHGGRRKPSVNLAQPFLDLGGGVVVQEQRGPAAQRAGAVAGQGGAVGQRRAAWSWRARLRGLRSGIAKRAAPDAIRRNALPAATLVAQRFRPVRRLLARHALHRRAGLRPLRHAPAGRGRGPAPSIATIA